MRHPLLPSFAVRVKGSVFVCFVLLAVSLPVIAQTQITTGTIQGTVLDANGAAVPGANVEIKNLDTNATTNLSSNEDGRFAALQLPPGKYSVTVAKQGFATLVLEDASLTVGQAINLPLVDEGFSGRGTSNHHGADS